MALGDLVASLAADPGAAGVDAIKQRQLLAQKLMEQGGSTAPIQSPWQGVANLVKGLQGGFEGYMADKQQKDWTQSGNDIFSKALAPQASSVAATPAPTDTPNLPAFAGGSADVAMPKYASAISGIESGGNYGATGPTTSSGDRAYGKYQVMGSNVGPWTKEILGQEMSPEEFLASKEAQDKVFSGKFGQYVAKTGNPQDAASMWFTGRPLAQGGNSSDVLGTTGAGYVAKFNAGINQGGGQQPAGPVQVASSDPNQAMALAAPAAATPAAAAISAASPVTPAASQSAITVPGYDGKFTRDQANDAEGVPSQAEWDAAAKAAATGAVAASAPPQAAAAAPAAASAPVPAVAKPAVDPRAAQILSAMADPHITPAQRQVLGLLYTNIKGQEQWSNPSKDADGNLISRNAQTGETKILVAGKDTNKTHVVGGKLIDDKGKVIYDSGSDAPDDKMIDFAANRLLAGDSSALTNLGRGAQSGKVVQSILKRAQEISESKGMDNAAAAQDILQKKADQMGRGAAARTGGTLNARMDVFSAEASSAMDLALETSRNLPRTSFLPLNKAIQALEKGAGSPELAQHVAQTNAVINTYAKAINPTGVPTQSDKDHAREQLNAAQSPEAYEATIRQMQREINVAHRAARSVKDLGGAEIPPPPSTTTPSGAAGAQSHGVWDAVKGMFGSPAAPAAGAKRFKYDASGNPVPQ